MYQQVCFHKNLVGGWDEQHPKPFLDFTKFFTHISGVLPPAILRGDALF